MPRFLFLTHAGIQIQYAFKNVQISQVAIKFSLKVETCISDSLSFKKVCVCVCVCARTHTYIHTHTHIFKSMYMHIYVFDYIYTHTHIYGQIWDYYFKWPVPFHKLPCMYIAHPCVRR